MITLFDVQDHWPLNQVKKLRNKISHKFLHTETPIVVYILVFTSIFLLWKYQSYNQDLALNLIAELFGAAFTLFIIDVLLVRAKRKRWKTVQNEIDYLIARIINRTRDGVSTRVFGFTVVSNQTLSTDAYHAEISKQRNHLLNDVVSFDKARILKSLNEKELFTENSYVYFNEKADEIWNILNMRYADYLHPELASLLIGLNLQLKDLCGHIRQYLKSNRFDENHNVHYKNIGRQGAVVCVVKMVEILNTLNSEGYSEPASIELADI